MSRLSILASTYEGHSEHQLRVFIHSILAQSFTDFTLYILADGPSPIARQICDSIKDKRLKYEESIKRFNLFGFPNRNKKLFEISSAFVTFQSCDNYVIPKAYEFLMSVADKQNADLVLSNICHNYAGINAWNRDGSKDERFINDPPYTVLDSLPQINKIDISNFIVKTKIAQSVGGFKTDLPPQLLPGADGFLIEDIVKKYGTSKVFKIKSCLFVHN